jgi:hypothetical protein
MYHIICVIVMPIVKHFQPSFEFILVFSSNKSSPSPILSAFVEHSGLFLFDFVISRGGLDLSTPHDDFSIAFIAICEWTEHFKTIMESNSIWRADVAIRRNFTPECRIDLQISQPLKRMWR